MTVTDKYSQTADLDLPATVTNAALQLSLAGVIRKCSTTEALLILNASIPPGTSVSVSVRGFAFDGEVMYCEQVDDLVEAHIYINDAVGTSSRRTPRFPVVIAAQVFAPGIEEPIPATIVDISGDGLGIELSEPLEEENLLAVESESNIAFGMVRFSRELPSGKFRVGVQLHRVIPK